ncbi:MAG: PQQ-binding-like beta-propeller repeat protein [Magnetococcales bacterium]|nr:PQQ-binding-like beta-propeller repeat protein [Magnetococcales bacterium]
MSGIDTAPRAVLCGDTGGNVAILNSVDGSTLWSFGPYYFYCLSAPALQIDSTVIFPVDSTSGSSNGILHAINLETGTEVWGGAGFQFGAGIRCTPAQYANRMFVATDDGYLWSLDISDMSNPSEQWGLNVTGVSQGDPKLANRITAAAQPPRTAATATSSCPNLAGSLLLSENGMTLFMTTASGLYAIDVSSTSSGTVLWYALADNDLSTANILLAGEWLLVTLGSSIYGFNVVCLPETGGIMEAEWQWTNPGDNPLASLGMTQFEQCVTGDSTGVFYLVNTATGEQSAIFTPLSDQTPGTVFSQWSQNYLVLLSNAGFYGGYQLEFAGSGPQLTQKWLLTSTTLFSRSPLLDYLWNPSDQAIFWCTATSLGDIMAASLEDGTQLWLLPIATGGNSICSATILNVAISTGAVRFLMDGSDYFITLRNFLLALAAGNFTDVDVTMPTDTTFKGLVQAAGSAGASVYVLLWDVGYLKKVAGLADKLGFPLGINLYCNKNTVTQLTGLTGISASLDTYGYLWTPQNLSASNHEKIAIFYIDGQKYALVAGLNTDADYMDQQSHPVCSPAYASCHDTAILLTGDACQRVETEFDRRWANSHAQQLPTTTGNYAKIAGWEVDGTMDLNALNCGGTSPAYTDPQITTGAVNLDVLSNNYEFITCQKTEIIQAIISEIGQATSSIYFENVGWTSADLVTTLTTRLKAADATNLTVIIMIPCPQPQEAEDSFQQAFNLLTYCSVVAIWLQLDNWTSFTTTDNETIQRTDLQSYSVTLRDYPFVTRSFSYTTKATQSSFTINLYEITAVNTTETRLILCGPARYFANVDASNTTHILNGWANNYRRIYIHSKLALFDDKVAILGSCNFNWRSLSMDGEMSVRIRDAATVQEIRTTLFNHWNMTDFATWTDKMTAFSQLATSGSTVEQVGILPTSLSNLWTSYSDMTWSAWFNLFWVGT